MVCWSRGGAEGTAGALAAAATQALAGTSSASSVGARDGMPSRVAAGRLPGEVLSATASWVRAAAVSSLGRLGPVDPAAPLADRERTSSGCRSTALPNAALLATAADPSDASLPCWVVRSRPLELPLRLVEPVPSADTARERRLAAKRERRGMAGAAGGGGGAVLRLQESLAGQQLTQRQLQPAASGTTDVTAAGARTAPRGGGSSADPTPEQEFAAGDGRPAGSGFADAKGPTARNDTGAGDGATSAPGIGSGAAAVAVAGGGVAEDSRALHRSKGRPEGLVRPAAAVPRAQAFPPAPACVTSSGLFAWPGASSIAPPSPGVAAGRARRRVRPKQAQQVPRQASLAREVTGAHKVPVGAARPSLTTGRPVGGLVGGSMRVGGFTIPTSLQAVAAVLRGLPAQSHE